MVVHARLAQQHLAGMTYEELCADAKTQAACLAELLIIGEAASKISPDFRASHSAILWGKWAKNRGRMIHGYDTIRWEVIWHMIRVDLPRLQTQLEELLDRLPND